MTLLTGAFLLAPAQCTALMYISFEASALKHRHVMLAQK